MKNIIFIILVYIGGLFANDTFKDIINIENVDSKIINIENNGYKTLKFGKRIIDIRLSNKDNLSIDFINDTKNPLTKIKIFAKKVGSTNALITFSDQTTIEIKFNISMDIRDLSSLVNAIDENVKLSQIKENIILKGSVKNNKILTNILNSIKDTVPKSKVINLLTITNPDKMVRLKLYVTEINNKKGETIKNNWSLSSINNNNGSYDVSTNMLSAVTLSGGITATANSIGKDFQTGVVLNYLKTNGVAKILDETTLVSLENKQATFHAGGNLLVETTSTTAQGLPTSQITTVPYGLELNINVKKIINDKYVNLEIDTKSSTLDRANGIGSLPATQEKSIKTEVIVSDNSTIVLGGLINNTNSKNWEKIPLISAIPIIGKLFQSKDFVDGNSELVFFITPTIVTTQTNIIEDKFKNSQQMFMDTNSSPTKMKENEL